MQQVSHNVKREEFFRMNFILQDSLATTTNTYLAKIIELDLYEANDGLTISEIADRIIQNQSLEFSIDEIKGAIRKSKNIVLIDDRYSLTPKHRSEMSSEPSIVSILDKYIDEAINDKNLQLTVSHEELKTLLMQYIYYCFNSNTESLMALIKGEYIDTKSFESSNEEIEIINKFLLWENPEKNKFVYKLISYGFIYCSLNVNKDSLLSSKIFRNKEFYLDANIIFRLAGLNNDDRRRTTVSFINKCKEVKIRLLYTNVTLQEVYNVITSRVNWIKGVTNSQEPLSPSELGRSDNDFYNLYDEWCRQGNTYNDFAAFRTFLFDRVNNILDDLTEVEIPDYAVTVQRLHDEYANNLRDYKDELSAHREYLSETEDTADEKAAPQVPPRKVHTINSASIDVHNYMYVIEKRRKAKEGNIFSTNQFLISADHYFMKWAAEKNSGVPVVVLPSVWLTILLRFSGRSDDDFKAFCSFMSLRAHEGPNEVDSFKIMQVAGRHTSDKELKRRIISEVIQHKEDYELSESHLDDTVCKAFDVIRDQDTAKLSEAFHKQLEVQQSVAAKKSSEDSENAARVANEMALRTATEVEVRNKTRIFVELRRAYEPIAFLLAILFAVSLVLWLYQKPPFYAIYENFFPTSINSMDLKLVCVGGFWAAIVVVYGFLGKFLKYMVSDERIERIRKNYRKQFSQQLSENN